MATEYNDDDDEYEQKERLYSCVSVKCVWAEFKERNQKKDSLNLNQNDDDGWMKFQLFYFFFEKKL